MGLLHYFFSSFLTRPFIFLRLAHLAAVLLLALFSLFLQSFLRLGLVYYHGESLACPERALGHALSAPRGSILLDVLLVLMYLPDLLHPI